MLKRYSNLPRFLITLQIKLPSDNLEAYSVSIQGWASGPALKNIYMLLPLNIYCCLKMFPWCCHHPRGEWHNHCCHEHRHSKWFCLVKIVLALVTCRGRNYFLLLLILGYAFIVSAVHSFWLICNYTTKNPTTYPSRYFGYI